MKFLKLGMTQDVKSTIMKLPTITEIENLKGKRVLLRLDLNVPIENGVIRDDFRIKKSQKTLDFLKKEGAIVIIISHIESGENNTLLPVAKYLDVPFVDIHTNSFPLKTLSSMGDGDVVLLENLRKDPGEKENSEFFAKKLASMADVFVNEAFSVSHRKHASVVGVPKILPTYFGFLFLEEVENLSKAFSPKHPFVFILGGAKFETKIPLVKKFLNIADKIFIGGALANSFFKEEGLEIGHSLSDNVNLDLKELLKNKKIIIPKDVVVGAGGHKCIKKIENIDKEDMIGDAGPEFIDEIDKEILSAKFILWNGPLGIFEGGFEEATKGLAKMIALSNATSIVGGGDTLASIKDLNIQDRFSFVSTGGGAMLDFLANGSLPGIDVVGK